MIKVFRANFKHGDLSIEYDGSQIKIVDGTEVGKTDTFTLAKETTDSLFNYFDELIKERAKHEKR